MIWRPRQTKSDSAEQAAPSNAQSVPAEVARLIEADSANKPWRQWGPYLSERAWGTVREDYSADGEAWTYFPFDEAASRTFRWSEDGLGGICDDSQILCMALGLWNGVDPILKERAFGLTGMQGNHGEDVKDCWWYLDATPTSSLLKWRYHYPQNRFPYEELISENASRTRLDPEYELIDTGIFNDNAYWVVTVTWAKAGPDDLLWRIQVENASDKPATIDLLPTIWYRNRWTWNGEAGKPSIFLDSSESESPIVLKTSGSELGERVLLCGLGSDGKAGNALFCDNETNLQALYGVKGPEFPKDGIARHLISSESTVNPGKSGTKASIHYRSEVGAKGSFEIRLRFCANSKIPTSATALGSDFETLIRQREKEADEYYADITPLDATDDEAAVLRQASAGMLWSKQFYHYDVKTWLDGDPKEPSPPAQRLTGRNNEWRHLSNKDVISMPDPWEYPWYAAWDLAFHTVSLAHLDPSFAKDQLTLLCREWYMHPNGQLPAYEWNFSDVNPPVHAWAASEVWRIDTAKRKQLGLKPDLDFLERVFHKLLINFTWWVNRKDAEGNNVFEGGFLGLDNIGPFDRSRPLPVPGILEQSDGTAWMATYCLSMLEIALRLADFDPIYEDVATKFYEHFTYIAHAMDEAQLWDDEDGFFYDVMHLDDGSRVPVRIRSMVGVIPLLAVTTLHPDLAARLPSFTKRIAWFEANRPTYGQCIAHTREPGMGDRRLLSIVDRERLIRVLSKVLDTEEMLSPYGVRSLSRIHRENPFRLSVGGQTATVDYEPAESTNALFGGNSNWRGPVWFPLNYLLIGALARFDRYFGDTLKIDDPAGSGHQVTLGEVSKDLSARLTSLFLKGTDGRRPVHGERELQQQDPRWKDLIWFHEYFHGDTGAGLGASHQTGWTGLVVDMIAGRALQNNAAPKKG